MQLVALSSTEQFGSDQLSFHTSARTYSSRGSQSRPEFQAELGGASEGEGYTNWVYYHKPVTVFVIGVFALLAGVILTILYFIRLVEVPYVLGPVCLSIGLMFMVTGLVWIPIVKEKIRQNRLIRKLHARRSAA
ncbi:phosphoinositide-interacting protein-like [Pristis pectinata]|uniref:phosphoinositide-interacting protein-like n=1 Tax=Pristis pectinata TaxID=685728 RepID=UPI00223E279C|nr:phosphoinositide-interacting protein-like [Pristis pectinata]